MKKKTKRILYVSVFLIVFVLSALIRMRLLGGAPQKIFAVDWKETSGSVYTDLSYPNDHENTYDLYLRSGLDPKEDQYLILYIHGGSFNSGSKTDGETYCKYYADKGYITASVDYTLQNKGLDATIDLMNQEILNAVGAIQEEAEALGYHIAGMAPFGVSAGGTLAMNLAYNEQSPVPVKFVFQLAAPTYFDPDDWDLLIKVDHLESKEAFLKMMTGEDLSLDHWKTAVDRISPASCVSSSSVPSLIGYGLIDHCVLLNQKYYLMDAYDAYGVCYDYVEFPKSNHGMYNDLDQLQKFADLSLEYAEKYFR